MALKKVWDEVGRLENAMKKRRGEKVKVCRQKIKARKIWWSEIKIKKSYDSTAAC
jgi:hypothetical protein